MSLFIAIKFSPETNRKLVSLLNELSTRSLSGNFTIPENLHLTLVFLGKCEEKQIIILKQTMRAISFKPFTITTAGGGHLDKGRPNLVFCDLRNDQGLNRLHRLQSYLAESLSVKGFKVGGNKFWPHITLGRKVVWKDLGKYNNFIEVKFPIMEERVTSIELMESVVGGSLPYTSIFVRAASER